MRILLIVLGFAASTATILQAADAKAGQAVYNKSCKSCHGAGGTANPAVAKMMKVEIQDLKSPEVQAMSDDDLKKIVADGKGKMRPVASVSGAAAGDLVAYLRSLK